MKILFDILHLAHLNFFKRAIYQLHREGFEIKITYLDRGKISRVLVKEFPDFVCTKIGTYSPTSVGKIPMVLKRARLFNRYLRQEKPGLTAGVGDFVLAAASRLKGIPSIQFYDDYEFKANFRLSQLFAKKLFIPFAIPSNSKKLIQYPSFKELSYLHPAGYKSNKKYLQEFGLKENQFVFVREVAGISMNYTNLKEGSLLPFIKHLHQQEIKVILSLEDKKQKERYAPFCTILEEPLGDVYSLIHFARFALSSGDSMAREAALLGVPCIYTGGRKMKVNEPFLEWGGIYKLEQESDILKKINLLWQKKAKAEWSEKIDQIIKGRLTDTTEIILQALKKELVK